MIRFGPFQVVRKLGAGGLADVFYAVAVEEAPDLLEGDVVALKILRDPQRSPLAVRRFIREGRLMQRLSHPGLPRCTMVIEGERPALALEYLPGMSLSDRVREAPVPPAEVLRCAEELLEVLAYLHGNGITHRDIKPANVHLSGERTVLLDLGLAADPRDPLDTTLGDVMGTYAYMAPEQIAGAAVDFRSDLYSLGITLYEAVAGDRPYKARGPAGYLRAHMKGGAEPLGRRAPEVPARLEELVTRLMARDPAARPQTAVVALAQLTGHAHAGRELSAPPLVGRAAAIGALEAVLDIGGVLHLVGEPGMGLGRMAQEAFDRARSRSMEAVVLRCRDRGDALLPLRRLVTEATGRAPGEGELVEALAGFVADAPLLLVIEDISEAPPRLLRELSRLLAIPGLRGVTTSGHPPLLPGRALELRPLKLEEVRELVAGMLGTPRIPAGQAEKLHRFSAGLPAAVVLSIRDFFDRGVLQCNGVGEDGEPAWTMPQAVRMSPDSSLNLLFRARLDQLGIGERRLLEVLSVAREELPLDLSLAVAGLQSDGLEAFRLVQAHLAGQRNDRGGDWIFVRRPALAALVAAELGEERRRRINAALARAIAELEPGPWRDDRLPWYKAHGAPAADAALALVELGEWLVAQLRPEALEVLTRAMHTPGLDTDTGARLALARGRALLAAGRLKEAGDSLVTARRMAGDRGARAEAEAETALAALRLTQGDLTSALIHADAALAALDQPVVEGETAAPLLIKGKALLARGHLTDGGSAFQQALELAGAVGNRDLAAEAFGGLGGVLVRLGRCPEALRHLGQESTWWRRRGRSAALVANLVEVAGARLRTGDVDGASEALEEARRCADGAEPPSLGALVAVAEAELALACGDAGLAAERLERTAAVVAEECPAELRIRWMAARVEVRLAQGDHSAALAAAHEVLEEAESCTFEPQAAFHAGLVAVLRAHAEDLLVAVERLRQVDDPRRMGRLLLAGSRLGRDPELLETAAEHARASGDAFLLLEVLYTSGASSMRDEAEQIARDVLARTSAGRARRLLDRPSFRWALSGMRDGSRSLEF